MAGQAASISSHSPVGVYDQNQANGTPIYSSRHLTSADLEGLLTDIKEVTDWGFFALTLGILNSEIVKCELENRGRIETCKRQILSKWLSDSDQGKLTQPASGAQIIKALRMTNGSALADSLKDKYLNMRNSSVEFRNTASVAGSVNYQTESQSSSEAQLFKEFLKQEQRTSKGFQKQLGQLQATSFESDSKLAKLESENAQLKQQLEFLLITSKQSDESKTTSRNASSQIFSHSSTSTSSSLSEQTLGELNKPLSTFHVVDVQSAINADGTLRNNWQEVGLKMRLDMNTMERIDLEEHGRIRSCVTKLAAEICKMQGSTAADVARAFVLVNPELNEHSKAIQLLKSI